MLQRPQPKTLITTLAVFRYFPLPFRTVSTAVATYYLSSSHHRFFQSRLHQTIRRLGYIPRHLVFQPLLPKALPRLCYNPLRLVYKQSHPQAHPRLSLNGQCPKFYLHRGRGSVIFFYQSSRLALLRLSSTTFPNLPILV